MGQIQVIASIFLITFFAIAIVSYATNFAVDNSAPVDLSDDDRIDVDIYRTDVQTAMQQVNESSTTFYQSSIKSGDDTTETGAVFKPLTMTLNSVKSIISSGNRILFGSEKGNSGFGIVLIGLVSFFTTIIILYTWKTWKGNPE